MCTVALQTPNNGDESSAGLACASIQPVHAEWNDRDEVHAACRGLDP
jgi:hypothetical protein